MDIASCGIVVYSCHVIYIKTNQLPPKAKEANNSMVERSHG